MRLILHILKKDLRRLWPLLVVWWVVLALKTAFPALLFFNQSSLGAVEEADVVDFLDLALVIADLALVVVIATGLVEADSPVNERAFWRTLPLPRGGMFVAKGLFGFLFLVLPALFCTLVTRLIYDFPLAQWPDGLALYVVERVGLVVLALAVPGIFRRPILAYIGIAVVALVIDFSIQLFPANISTESPYLLINGGDVAAFSVVILGTCAFIGCALFLRRRRGLNRLLAVAGLLLVGLYVKMLVGLDANAFANLLTTRGAVESLPFLFGGIAASLFIYSRFQPFRGALIILIGLLATINVMAWGPAPDLANPAHPKPELLQLPPGNTIIARGGTGFPRDPWAEARLQLPPGTVPPPEIPPPQPKLIFVSRNSGNRSIFDPNLDWDFCYTTATIRWPDGTKIQFFNNGREYNNLDKLINFLVTGRKNPDPTPSVVEKEFELNQVGYVPYDRLQREPAIIEGKAQYIAGGFEKIADLPLVNGTASTLGTNHSLLHDMEMDSRPPDFEGLRWYSAHLNVAILSSHGVERVYDYTHLESSSLLFVLWNPAQPEIFHAFSPDPLVNADFSENGITFNLGKYELTAPLFSAVSASNGHPAPMSEPEAEAWLAGARLLAFRYTPKIYYLPFKTEPFVLQSTPPTP